VNRRILRRPDPDVDADDVEAVAEPVEVAS